MKLIPVICALLFGSLSLSAQTLYVPSGTVGTSTNAFVGIGTSSPAGLLDLTRVQTSGIALIAQDGVADHNNPLIYSYKVGTTGAAALLGFNYYIDASGNGAKRINTAKNGWAFNFDTRNSNNDASLILAQVSSTGIDSKCVAVTADGNVGIGTLYPTQKLSVNGAIRAKEVIVDTGWSDYVFAPDYRLAPLSEVEQHIKAEQHLPGIPSAAEVAEHGISVGEMQAKLLAKIEELTLHVIEQEKRTQAQAVGMAALLAENAELRARVDALSQRR